MQPKSPPNLEQSYNEVPYPSYPYFQTHPAHLYTIATLFGLNPTPIESCKVLELGCAGGGNLIPMAYRLKNSQFLGIDLSANELSEGTHKINELKIKNIILKHQSILDVNKSTGKFDYIICHGIYSWVDDPIRNKILEICSNNLTENGIAYISYNTLPGWNFVNSIVDLMKWHSRDIHEPIAKVKNARKFLKFFAQGKKDDTSVYGQFIKNEYETLSKQSDEYILHDHLSDINKPIYISDFIEHAKAHQLSYITDALLMTSYRDILPAPFVDEVRQMEDIGAIEQYIDFVHNNRFRRSLLCHSHHSINRKIDIDNIDNLYFKFSGECDKSDLSEKNILSNKELTIYTSYSHLTVTKPIAQQILLVFMKEKNRYFHFKELCQEIVDKKYAKNIEDAKYYIKENINLMLCAFAGLFEISAYPPGYTLAIADKPLACPLVRFQAKSQNYIATLTHQLIYLEEATKELLPFLDGTNDFNSLCEIARNHLDLETLELLDENKKPIEDPIKINNKVENFVSRTLQQIAGYGILIEKES